ncbi:MAG: hypothetical protein HYZ25_16060 [Chloroflexi bacterium]|nr:hypothetical protein [Chloroflexota bacterium]
MLRIRMILIACLLLIQTAAFTKAMPLPAFMLQEGRTYDQAHDTGYLDWSGPVQYFYLTHRDGAFLPPEEGGASCMGQCQEWVTVLGNGGRVSGVFERDVTYFEVMIAFSHDTEIGSAILQACSSYSVSELYLGPGSGYPGFISVDLAVPAGCRNWSLTAQGGFVPFRSVDVYYTTTPPVPTSTVTPSGYYTPFPTPPATQTPTLPPSPTRTPAASPTSTFPATSTPTLVPTATPLPPILSGHVSCELAGEEGWCREDAALVLHASDPQGWDVFIRGDIGGVPFACGASCTLSLSEGIGTAHYTAISATGRTANGLSTWKLDSTPPDLDLLLPTVDGDHGWHRSPVSVRAEASDATSGLESVRISLDEGDTWNTLPIRLEDGVFPIAVQAVDMAGNKRLETRIVSVDTMPPTSGFSKPSGGAVLQGSVTLTGTSDDETSGVSVVQVSTDSGASWQSLTTHAGAWSMLWHTQNLPNGPYGLWTRAIDEAGNLGEPSLLSVWVDNHPPKVLLAERWWIWEAGALKISTDYFPLREVQVTITDGLRRWPEVTLSYDPKHIPVSVSWDRRFSDGTLAPSGEYRVTVRACDIHELCGTDTGMIVIPQGAAPSATLPSTASPTLTSTATPTARPLVTQTLAPPSQTATPVEFVPEPLQQGPVVSIPLWQALGLLGLMFVLAAVSLADPRPAALGRLRKVIGQIGQITTSDEGKDES